MLTTTFKKLSATANLQEAISSGVCLLQHKGQDRKPKATCLLLNVTGLTDQSIEDLVKATTKVILIAKGE